MSSEKEQLSQKELQALIIEKQLISGERTVIADDNDHFKGYIRRRRFKKALEILRRSIKVDYNWEVLTLCDGEGSTALWMLEEGFKNITSSDISKYACEVTRTRNPDIKALPLDCENTQLPDNSYDITIEQSGLHHLTSPVGGFVEMLRISRHAVIFIEPAKSIINTLLGGKWEVHGGIENWVFRWSNEMINDVCSSYLLHNFENKSERFWWHNVWFAHLKYRALADAANSVLSLLPIQGNQMVAVILKKSLK